MEPSTLHKLANKVIVVIGGTTGLGLSAARAFVEAGAQVVVVGRNHESAARAEAALGKAGRALPADACVPLTAPAAIQVALDSFGGFHGLYHVAGGSGRKMGDGPLHEISDSGWEFTVNLNLTILNMGSVLGFSPSPRFFGTHAYAAAKAAIIGLTKSAASFYAKDNIRLNVLAPGLVATPMSERAQTDRAILDFVAAKQPLEGGRIGNSSDFDAAAVYFLSDDSKFVTGQVLAVDGGWSVCEGQHG